MHDYSGLITCRLGFDSQYCRNEIVTKEEDVHELSILCTNALSVTYKYYYIILQEGAIKS